MYEYKVNWCPICDPGWVEIVKNTVTNQLELMCEECETRWDDPEMKNAQEEFSTHRVVKPTLEEIQLKNWDKYILIE